MACQLLGPGGFTRPRRPRVCCAPRQAGPGRNEVKVAGHRGRDQVLCAPGSVDRIFADRGDYIAPSCREAPRSRVVYHRPPRSAQPARDPDGCTNNPHVDCTFLNIDFFAPRLVRPDDYVIGAQVGSVTNWTFSPQSWHMWLHCTSDKSQGWKHGS